MQIKITDAYMYILFFVHLFFIQFLKVTLHLQLLQNIDSVPCVILEILVTCLTLNSLHIPLPHPYIAPPLSLPTGSH